MPAPEPTTDTKTMPDTRTRLLELLDQLQTELQRLDLWETAPPAPEAFQSQTPFFADTLAFTQWLQWVFIARFRAILEGHHPLPAQCDVAPLAKETLRDLDRPTDHLVSLLQRFDAHF